MKRDYGFNAEVAECMKCIFNIEKSNCGKEKREKIKCHRGDEE
ncbi:hypothetical protein [Orenia metallireducens]|nr:hypothetical protein [Orenia metallireducens]